MSVAIVPSVRLTAITTIFTPTLKLSTSDAGAAPSNMKTRSACSVPIPAGVSGNNVERVWAT